MIKTPLIYAVLDSVSSALPYQNYLDTLGYRVRIFHTGQDALEVINEQTLDLLI